MAWALQFDGVNDYLTTPLWSASGDFNISVPFTSGSLATSEGILGHSANNNSYLAQYTNGNLEFRIGAVSMPVVTGLVSGVDYVANITRTGSLVTLEVVGVGTQTLTSTSAFYVNYLGRIAAGLSFSGLIRDVVLLSRSGDVRSLDCNASDHSNTGSQPVLVDTIGGNNATGVGFATDGSAWVDLGGGATFKPFWASQANNLIGGM